jgi:hypothetical protein
MLAHARTVREMIYGGLRRAPAGDMLAGCAGQPSAASDAEQGCSGRSDSSSSASKLPGSLADLPDARTLITAGDNPDRLVPA